jgi:hypothetical protein
MYWEYYSKAAKNPLAFKELVIRDPLGYGSMFVLAQLFPHSPVTYYFLNIFLWSGALFFSFRQLIKRYDFSYVGKITIFLYLFFLLFDLDDVHHSMRHSTACSLIGLSFMIFEQKKWSSILLFIAAVLWQGTLIIFTPLFFLYKFSWSKKKTYTLSLFMIIMAFGFSYINMYELIPKSFLHHEWIYQYFPRIYLFFLRPEKSQLFELSKSIGHDPFWMLELPFYVMTMGFLSIAKFYNRFLILSLSFAFLFVVAFRFHFSMILRFELMFELMARLVLLWIIVQLLRKKEQNFSGSDV